MNNPLDVFERQQEGVVALIWDDDLEHGEYHTDDCAKVTSQRRIFRERRESGNPGNFATRKELSELLRRRQPCDCGR